MALSSLDLAVIAGYVVVTMAAGLWASRGSGGSGEAFFLAGRTLPGWLLGVSIVATTFAADTPLAVSGMVAGKGIAANWFWFSLGTAHVAMFLFWAPLWRRAGVVTDAELAELRYGGRAGRELRTAKALFFAVFFNAIVLGWVIRAMQKIAQPFARWDAWLPEALYGRLHEWWRPGTPLGGLDEMLTIVALVTLATIYSALGGLRAVILTDLVQLGLALVGAFALAVCALSEAGGLAGLPGRLADLLGPGRAAEVLAFVPPKEGMPWLSIEAFAVYLVVRWWAHPMADGGGYIAQRLMAAPDPRQARVASGVFLALHYVVRPWPWIVVGLVSLVLFPPGAETALFPEGAQVAADREMAYPVVAGLVLPSGMLGLLIASLLAAFMSTIDTHLNWGMSYLAHDIWKGRWRRGASDREVAVVGQVGSVVLAVLAIAVTTQIDSVEKAWKFVAALGSGLGLPTLLRWAWWRVNAQAELLGAVGSLAATVLLAIFAPQGWPWEYELAIAVLAGLAGSAFAIIRYGPPAEATLEGFFRRVRPPGFWGPVRRKVEAEGGLPGAGVAPLALAWACGSIGLFAAIFLPGWLLLAAWGKAALAAVVAVAGWIAALRLAREPADHDVGADGGAAVQVG